MISFRSRSKSPVSNFHIGYSAIHKAAGLCAANRNTIDSIYSETVLSFMANGHFSILQELYQANPRNGWKRVRPAAL